VSEIRFFLKVGFARVIRGPDVVIRTGSRLSFICGESIDRRGIGRWPGLSFHISQAKVFENLFDHIRILNHRNYAHFKRTFWTQKWINFLNLLY